MKASLDLTPTPAVTAVQTAGLKIAHIFQASGLRFSEAGAAQLHVYHTMRGLQRVGHHVALLALHDGRRVLLTEDLNVFRNDELQLTHFGQLGASAAYPFKLFESSVRRLQTELDLPYIGLFDSYRIYDACAHNLQEYDLIHERYNLFAFGGALASRRLGIPLVLEVNADLLQQRQFKGMPETGLRRRAAIWATHFNFSSAAKIICISDELREHLHRSWGVPAHKLVVLPCAADVDAFGKAYDTSAVRRRLGLGSEPVIMWIGGFYRWHDLNLLLDSFSNVLVKFPQAKLVLIGDGETRSDIEHTVQTRGWQRAVIMTGSVPHAQIPEMLSIADLTVVPSTPTPADQGGTGTPLKLFEYMAAGKPIVATGLNHATGVVDDGRTGILVAPQDMEGFASAIVRLLGNPKERHRLGENARHKAVAQYSWRVYTQHLEEIYQSI